MRALVLLCILVASCGPISTPDPPACQGKPDCGVDNAGVPLAATCECIGDVCEWGCHTSGAWR